MSFVKVSGVFLKSTWPLFLVLSCLFLFVFASSPSRATDPGQISISDTTPPPAAVTAQPTVYHPDPGPIELPTPARTVKMRSELIGVHPRIFMTSSDVLLMREKIKNPTVVPMWSEYLREVDKLGSETPPLSPRLTEDPFRGFGDRLPELAFAYVVSQDPKYLEEARKWIHAVAQYPNWAGDEDLGAGHCCAGLAIAYDWLYADLSGAEKKEIEDALTRHARILLRRSLLNPGSWWGYSYFQNHCWINHTGVALAAMATYEINSQEKQQWLDYTRDKFQPTYENLGLDGGYYEGPAYLSYGTAWILYYIEALKSISGEDLSGMTYLNKVSKHMFDMMMPGDFCMANFGDADAYGWGKGLGDDILIWLASRHKDGHPEWLREKNRAGLRAASGHEPPFSSPFALLWFDPALAPKPPDDLSTTGVYADLGLVTFRTSWKDDAAMVAFHCGPPGGLHLVNYCASTPNTSAGFSHCHPDAGNFLFWSKARWRIGLPGGYTHDKKTHDENVWLSNGAGQRGEAMWFNAQSYIGAPAQPHLTDLATSPQADYVVGEAAPAYATDAHLTHFLRHLLFVKGASPYVVIYDVLEADQFVDWASYLHVYDPPELLGSGQFQMTTSPLSGTRLAAGPADAAAPDSTNSPAPDTTFGFVFGAQPLAQDTHPLIVAAHTTDTKNKVMQQRGYEITTASLKGTSTWQVTVITAQPGVVKMLADAPNPKLEVGGDSIEWQADGTVLLNRTELKPIPIQP